MSDKKDKSWPIGIFGFYTIFVLAMLGFMIFSFSNTMDMVEENYYEKSLNFEAQIEGIRNTNSLAIKPEFRVNKSIGQVILTLPQEFENDKLIGSIKFFRPSDASLDTGLNLKVNSENMQVIPVSNLQSGKWKVQLSWKYFDKNYYLEEVLIL